MLKMNKEEKKTQIWVPRQLTVAIQSYAVALQRLQLLYQYL